MTRPYRVSWHWSRKTRLSLPRLTGTSAKLGEICQSHALDGFVPYSALLLTHPPLRTHATAIWSGRSH